MFRKNSRFLIKTPTGFEHFEGVQKKTVDTLYTFTFTDGTEIKCSGGHAFLTDKGFLKAENITKENTVTGKHIHSISYETGNFEVYDPVGVENHSTYYSAGVVSHNTEFIGSSNTLISAAKLRAMPFSAPIDRDGNLEIFEKSKPDNVYAIMVDVARGQGLDYSAFSVIDVTQIPYRQVAKYRDNNISPLLYPALIFNAGKIYNDAFVLVEISDIGQQIADILHYELEYENLVKIQSKPKQGQQVSAGYTKKIAFGIKTSTATKRIGCSNLKTMIESDKLIVQDPDTIMELTTFVAQRESFAAEEGNHDDLAMTLVLFGWFVAQRNFKDAMTNDIRRMLQEEQLNMMDEDMVPFGIIDDGIEKEDPREQMFDRWVESRQRVYPLDSHLYDWKERF